MLRVAPVVVRERCTRVFVVARVMLLYILRVVITKGALRSSAVRWVAALCIVLLLITASAISVMTFSGARNNSFAVDLIFSINSVSSVLWSALAFLITKMLMASSSGMMSLTNLLAVTNKERQRAVDVLEILALFVIISAGLFSMTVGTMVSFGDEAVVPLLTCVVLPVLTTLAVLTTLYRVTDLMLAHLGINKNRGSIMIALFFFVVVASWRESISLVVKIASPMEKQPFSIWTLAYKDLVERYGSASLVFIFPACLFALVAAFVLVPSTNMEARSRFFDFPLPGSFVSGIKFHLAYVLRSRYAVESALLSIVFIAFMATFPPGDVPSVLWGVEPVTFSGFYHFASVNPSIRVLEPNLSSTRMYSRMMVSQLLVVGCLASLATFFDVLRGEELSATLTGAVGVLGSLIISICVGIAMPAMDDNPISVLVGTCIALSVLILLSIITGVINVNSATTAMLVVLVACLAVAYSIYSLEANRKVNHASR